MFLERHFTMRHAILIVLIAMTTACVDDSDDDLHSIAGSGTEFAELLKEAKAKGAVRVMVSLDVDVTAVVPAKTEALLAELGNSVWKSGRWFNGAGQLGFYATPEALQYLASSSNVRHFTRDTTSSMRRTVPDIDGRVSAIDAEIDKIGFADVEVVLNVDSLKYDFHADGTVSYAAADALEIAAAKTDLQMSFHSHSLLNPGVLEGNSGSNPVLTLRVTREGLYVLVEHPRVRSVQLIGYKDERAVFVDPDALEEATRAGMAEVIVELRGSHPYNPGIGNMSAAALAHQRAAIRTAFAGLLGDYWNTNDKRELSDFGAASIWLGRAALESLAKSTDMRLLSIKLNKPVAL